MARPHVLVNTPVVSAVDRWVRACYDFAYHRRVSRTGRRRQRASEGRVAESGVLRQQLGAVVLAERAACSIGVAELHSDGLAGVVLDEVVRQHARHELRRVEAVAEVVLALLSLLVAAVSDDGRVALVVASVGPAEAQRVALDADVSERADGVRQVVVQLAARRRDAHDLACRGERVRGRREEQRSDLHAVERRGCDCVHWLHTSCGGGR